MDYVVSHCRDRRVLDLGCADHQVDAVDDLWLHKHIVEVARSCLGADVDAGGVAEMQARGYNAVVADITNEADLRSLADRGPFDIVVAGEVIEHLSCPRAVFDAAAAVLPAGGQLLLTSPNPYAPWRARAGLTGRVWENVDHVTYLFPSGVAELASRSGFTLVEFGTASWGRGPDISPALDLRWLVAACYHRFVRGRREEGRWLGLPLHPRYLGPLDLLQLSFRLKPGLWREAAVYLLEKVP